MREVGIRNGQPYGRDLTAEEEQRITAVEQSVLDRAAEAAAARAAREALAAKLDTETITVGDLRAAGFLDIGEPETDPPQEDI